MANFEQAALVAWLTLTTLSAMVLTGLWALLEERAPPAPTDEPPPPAPAGGPFSEPRQRQPTRNWSPADAGPYTSPAAPCDERETPPRKNPRRQHFSVSQAVMAAAGGWFAAFFVLLLVAAHGPTSAMDDRAWVVYPLGLVVANSLFLFLFCWRGGTMSAARAGLLAAGHAVLIGGGVAALAAIVLQRVASP